MRKIKQNKYIWCFVIGGIVCPMGHAKTYKYAIKCAENKNPKYKLFKLIRCNKNGEEKKNGK